LAHASNRRESCSSGAGAPGRTASVLIATLQAAVPDVDLLGLRTALVREVVRCRSRGVIVDVTAIDVMDSFASHILQTWRT